MSRSYAILSASDYFKINVDEFLNDRTSLRYSTGGGELFIVKYNDVNIPNTIQNTFPILSGLTLSQVLTNIDTPQWRLSSLDPDINSSIYYDRTKIFNIQYQEDINNFTLELKKNNLWDNLYEGWLLDKKYNTDNTNYVVPLKSLNHTFSCFSSDILGYILPEGFNNNIFSENNYFFNLVISQSGGPFYPNNFTWGFEISGMYSSDGFNWNYFKTPYEIINYSNNLETPALTLNPQLKYFYDRYYILSNNSLSAYYSFNLQDWTTFQLPKSGIWTQLLEAENKLYCYSPTTSTVLVNSYSTIFSSYSSFFPFIPPFYYYYSNTIYTKKNKFLVIGGYSYGDSSYFVPADRTIYPSLSSEDGINFNQIYLTAARLSIPFHSNLKRPRSLYVYGDDESVALLISFNLIYKVNENYALSLLPTPFSFMPEQLFNVTYFSNIKTFLIGGYSTNFSTDLSTFTPLKRLVERQYRLSFFNNVNQTTESIQSVGYTNNRFLFTFNGYTGGIHSNKIVLSGCNFVQDTIFSKGLRLYNQPAILLQSPYPTSPIIFNSQVNQPLSIVTVFSPYTNNIVPDSPVFGNTSISANENSLFGINFNNLNSSIVTYLTGNKDSKLQSQSFLNVPLSSYYFVGLSIDNNNNITSFCNNSSIKWSIGETIPNFGANIVGFGCDVISNLGGYRGINTSPLNTFNGLIHSGFVFSSAINFSTFYDVYKKTLGYDLQLTDIT